MIQVIRQIRWRSLQTTNEFLITLRGRIIRRFQRRGEPLRLDDDLRSVWQMDVGRKFDHVILDCGGEAHVPKVNRAFRRVKSYGRITTR